MSGVDPVPEPGVSKKGRLWLRPWSKTMGDPALRREADMMGLYVAVALIGELTIGKDQAKTSDLKVLAIVWGTTLGLALAHWFALGISARLVRDPDFHHSASEVLISQTSMAFVVALLATVAVLITPSDAHRVGARLAAALFIGLLVLIESRAGGISSRRALGRGALALGVACVIVATKWFLK